VTTSHRARECAKLRGVTEHAIHDRDTLVTYVRRGGRPAYLFFWGHKAPPSGEVGKHCLSQWWPAPFAVGSALYATAEHFMMAEKARLFADPDAEERILSAPSPAAAKKLGRSVRGFDEARWAAARSEIVVRGSVAKFAQNPELLAFLLDTGDRVLVEASPVDRIWGIGLRGEDARSKNPEQWRGLNLLGFALMEARRQLQLEARK
jgi:ribA/ribD-fused uncharacterized protein